MSVVASGVIRQLSVSQAEKFVSCSRAWYFEQVEGRKPDDTDAKTDGDIGHEHLARYLLTGNPPVGRVKLGAAVRAAIVKGWLPAPGLDLHVERRFDGGPKLNPDGKWRPMDRERTFWLGGLPWDGFIDLRFRRSPVVDILDHKFSSRIHAPWTKQGPDLIRTVQMPVYALDSLRVWPDAKEFRFTHHMVSRTGQDSDLRVSPVITLDQLLERKEQIEQTVRDMKQTARAPVQEDVPFNRNACSAYNGCPHQSICTAFKERRMNMTPEEAALFAGLDAAPAPVPTAPEAPPVASPQAVPKPAPAAPKGKEIRCVRCEHSFGERPSGNTISMSLCPNVSEHGADCDSCGYPVELSSDGPRCPNAASHVPKVVPRDAPANSVDVAPPEKAKRKSKEKKSVRDDQPVVGVHFAEELVASAEAAMAEVFTPEPVPSVVASNVPVQVIRHEIVIKLDPEFLASIIATIKGI